MVVSLFIALRNLIQSRRRTLLLGVAVGLVATLFFILRVVAGSVSERMVEAATTLSSGHVNIAGFYKIRKKGSDPIVARRAELLAFARQRVPEATTIIDRHRGWGRMVSPQSSINVGMYGIQFEQEAQFFRNLRLAPESEYREGGGQLPKGAFAGMQEPNSVLIFAAQAKKLGVGVGDSITVVTEASGGQSNTVDLKVVAIASDLGFMSNWNIFVPRQTILDLYRVDADTTGSVMIYLPSQDQSQAIMERLRKDLTAAGYQVMDHDPKPFFMKFDKVMGEDWLGQKLDLTIWSDEISFILWITTALDFISFFIISILALIIMGGITNSTWMAVRERTKEIGTMRAIGTPKAFIVRMFVAESVFLGAGAATIGVAIGGLMVFALNSLKLPITVEGIRLFLMANEVRLNMHPIQFVSTIVLFSLVTGLASLYPAIRAARMRPVEALTQIK